MRYEPIVMSLYVSVVCPRWEGGSCPRPPVVGVTCRSLHLSSSTSTEQTKKRECAHTQDTRVTQARKTNKRTVKTRADLSRSLTSKDTHEGLSSPLTIANKSQLRGESLKLAFTPSTTAKSLQLYVTPSDQSLKNVRAVQKAVTSAP